MPHLAHAWVFALASVMEASPNVILEAMSMKLPVVATRVGGIPELIQDGYTGLVVKPREPEALAAALIAVLTDESKRLTMGEMARQRVLENHTLETMVRRTEQVIMEAVQEAFIRQ